MTSRLILLAGLALACRPLPAQESELVQPKATPEDRAEGQRIFGTQCSFCHGPKGEGGQGAVLAVPRLSHAPDDVSLFRVIRDGIPGTKMPANALTPAQLWQVVAFVRSLGHVEGSKLTRRSRAWPADLRNQGSVRAMSHHRRPWRRHRSGPDGDRHSPKCGPSADLAPGSGRLCPARFPPGPRGDERRPQPDRGARK